MKSYVYALIASLILLGAHLLAIEHHLYVAYDPFDIFMHIFGGLALGLFIVSILKKRRYTLKHPVFVVLLGVFVLGLAWEIFEAMYNIAGHPVGTKLYYVDCIKDIIDDVVGGSIATIFLRKR